MLTSKQRAFLRSLAMTEEPIIYLGKASLTPENTKNVEEALAKRELIKIGVQKNCADDPMELADIVAERTHAEVVQVIGKKIVLYRQGKDKNRKIELPKKQ
jgi:RNA-binding protein